MKKQLNFTRAALSLAAATLLLFTGARPCTALEDTVKSEVSTSTAINGWAVNYPKQRKVFFMSGLLWVFYSDGANGVYRTSPDGVKWSEPAMFGTNGHFGHRFAGWFDGVYFHYVLSSASRGDDVFYRRGKPNPDGTIAWSAPEQTAYDTPPDMNVMYPKIIVDSNGFPWIAFMELAYRVPTTPPYDAIVIKASTHDGTWTTAAGFPFKLVHNGVEGLPDPVGAPLTNGKTLWFYNAHVGGSYVYAARAWNGSSWENEEIVANPAPAYSFFNVVADGDDVHVVHFTSSLIYQKRTWGSGWSQPFTVAEGALSAHTSITRVGPDNVIVTWLDFSPNANAVYCRELAGGAWGPRVTLGTSDHLSDGVNLNTLVHSAKPFKNAVVYSTGDAPPFKVNFAAVTVPPPVNSGH